MTRTEEFARVFFTAHYEAAHGDGGEEAWTRLSDGERELWLQGGAAIDRCVAGAPLRDHQDVQMGDGNNQVNTFGGGL